MIDFDTSAVGDRLHDPRHGYVYEVLKTVQLDGKTIAVVLEGVPSNGHKHYVNPGSYLAGSCTKIESAPRPLPAHPEPPPYERFSVRRGTRPATAGSSRAATGNIPAPASRRATTTGHGAHGTSCRARRSSCGTGYRGLGPQRRFVASSPNHAAPVQGTITCEDVFEVLLHSGYEISAHTVKDIENLFKTAAKPKDTP